jgi:hypothetical protein
VTGASPADDCEAQLVESAMQCARLVGVLKQQGARRGRRAQTAALAAELAEVQRLGALVCAGGWVADEEIQKLTQRFSQVSILLFEEIKPCHEKTC